MNWIEKRLIAHGVPEGRACIVASLAANGNWTEAGHNIQGNQRATRFLEELRGGCNARF